MPDVVPTPSTSTAPMQPVAGSGSTAAGGPEVAGRGRVTAIDVLRGACIVSMTTAHLASGSWPWQLTHAAVVIDGGVGFVLLSGLVVGITQRRTVVTEGVLAGQRKLLRRTGVIYGGHLALCLVGFLAVAADPGRAGEYVSVHTLGGPLPATLATLTLQVNPYYTSILSLYVMLLLLAVGAVGALARWGPIPVFIGGFALYLAGWLWPEVFTFAARPGVASPVNWATWQLLFLGALLIGWQWTASWVRRALRSRVVLAVMVVVLASGAAAGWVLERWADRATTTSAWGRVVLALLTEGALAPGAIVVAVAAALVGYRVVQFLLGPLAKRYAAPVLVPLALIGRQSLDCYLILGVVVILLPSVLRYPPASVSGVAVTAAVLLSMAAWCLLRDRLGTIAEHPAGQSSR